VAYGLLTGKLVFEGPGMIKVMYDHVHTPPAPPSSHAGDYLSEQREVGGIAHALLLTSTPVVVPTSIGEVSFLEPREATATASSRGCGRASTAATTDGDSLAAYPEAHRRPFPGDTVACA